MNDRSSPYRELGMNGRDVTVKAKRSSINTVGAYEPPARWGHQFLTPPTVVETNRDRANVYHANTRARTCSKCGLPEFIAEGRRCRGRRA